MGAVRGYLCGGCQPRWALGCIVRPPSAPCPTPTPRSHNTREAGRLGGLLDGPLHGRVGAVVAADRPAARVFREGRGGKHVLPAPLGFCIRILLCNGIRQVDAAHAVGTVRLVLGLHCFQVAPERAVEALGQHRRPVRAALSVPDVEAVGSNVEFFDPKTEGFGQSQSAAVEKMRDQAIRTCRHGAEQATHLVAREHRGEAARLVGPVDRANAAKLFAQHLLVEKE